MLQDQETHSPALPIGYSLQEYTIEAVLGIGGFGITYLAHDTHLHHKVAIKEFFPANLAARNPATGTVGIKSSDCQTEFTWGKTRYTQEAQTLARFNHPNIVRVSRYFEANSTSYLVMDFEEGKSLESILKEGGEWTQSRLLDVLLPLLSGLAEIHKGSYLHRDIKPENIILRSKDNTPVLLDFGAARSTTDSMTAMVSPGYGPAEQYSSDNDDQGPWTDIYALAAVAYRVISGRVPVPAPNRLKKDSLIPAVFVGDGRYSKAFLSSIDSALSIDEKKRPQDALTWAEALSTLAIPTEQPTKAVQTVEPSAAPAPRIPPAAISDQKPIRIATPSLAPSAPNTPTANHPALKFKEMPRRETFFQRHDIGFRHLWWSMACVFLVLATAAIAVLSTDKGYLRTAHFLYTTALKANNPDFTYTFICPSYFQSEMNRTNLNGDMQSPSWADDIVIDSANKATIGLIDKQTWTKPTPDSPWCRDVLVDFSHDKAQLKAEQIKSRATANKSPKKR